MIIVTGGAGFIGSAVIWKLNQEGYNDILVVDSLKNTDKWKNIVSLNFTEYMDKGTFINFILEKKGFKACEAIIHMGACSSTTESNMDYLIMNNYEYSKMLVEYAMANQIRFIYASSAATYGDGSLGFKDDHGQLPSHFPLNGYAFSKFLFDKWLFQYGLLEKVVGLKFFNVFGPNEYHKADMRSMVLRGFEQIRDQGQVALFKSYKDKYRDGEQLRDFVYIKDVVNIIWFFFAKKELFGIYNVGSGKAQSFNELMNAIFDALSKPKRINYIDMPDGLKTKYQYFTEADTSKLKSVGFNEKLMPLKEAVADYVKNYLLPNAYLKP